MLKIGGRLWKACKLLCVIYPMLEKAVVSPGQLPKRALKGGCNVSPH